ncbi:lipid A export permease/ATP-binding protein MsbA [Desulfopila sp. IMCC35008]|uniref:lipid A export permease/ATP-binding protein MsbA n=1 Tax=Desulfopila sp. IMCC35008 TaxID=2653858 RepID=UPI0013D6BBDD|nr:lipid A export permease/ATP-binding protein MsbA [Desulfopila sp. IMCC35008]
MPNKEILRRLYEIIKPYRPLLGIAMVCMILHSAFTTAQAWILKPVIDDMFIEKDMNMLKLLPFAIFFIFLMISMFNYCYTFLLEKIGQSIIQNLRVRLFEHIHKQPLSFFHEHSTGTLISRVISDVTLMQISVSNALVNITKDFFLVLFLLIFVFYQNWELALITFILLPTAALPIVKFSKLFRQFSTRTQEETAKVSDRLYETITGNRIVKAFSKEKYEVDRFQDQVNALFAIVLKDAKYRSMQHPLMHTIGGVAFSVIVWVGGKEVIYDGASPGTFFAFLVALIAAYEPVKNLSRINPLIQQGMAAATRIFSILDIEPEIRDKDGAVPLQPFTTRIDFKNVNFSYDKDTQVLSDVNLSVPSGQALAIVGHSGGGKTTITNLIPRFLDIKKGSITIDGTDIRDVTLSSLRSQIAMVTQQTILFNDTVQNNIAYGDLNASIEEIRKAAKAAYALDFIDNLPNGFDTIIGEGGARLSGGERQRVSIARAILKNAPILILDEATSALDTESEREVQKALENLMKNKTTFVIAHRLSTIKNCDRIIVIKEGKIVEQGTHDELLSLNGEYEVLYNMQYK